MVRVVAMMILVGCGAQTAAPAAIESSPAAVTRGGEEPETADLPELSVGTEPAIAEPINPGETTRPPASVDVVAKPPPKPVVSAELAGAAELYAQCHDRLELPEKDGECAVDSDCTSAGCSQEICTTPAAAAGMMSMCDMQPCFEVVKDCGCVQGRCTWSLQAPAKLRKLNLPH